MVLKSTMRPCASTKTRAVALIPLSDMLTSNEWSSTAVRLTAGVRSIDGANIRAVVDVGHKFTDVELRPRAVCHGQVLIRGQSEALASPSLWLSISVVEFS